jgi:hypothetical protein
MIQLFNELKSRVKNIKTISAIKNKLISKKTKSYIQIEK